MNKICIFLLTAILLTSCSISLDQFFLIPTETPTPAPTSTVAPTIVPTYTATIATTTFTPTPTLVGQKDATPTLSITPTVPTMTPLAFFPPNTPTAAVKMKGFVTAYASLKEFFKAGVCEPTKVKFTAQVAKPSATAFVQLFVRFKSKTTGATSEWTSIKMDTLGAGTYTYDLVAAEMKGVDSFRDSWVQFQFVATDSRINEIGRTDIFAEYLSVLECVPTPTPLESPTPTVTPS